MNISVSFSLGKLSKEGYRHYPLLYFAHGTNGGSLTIIGLTIVIKL